MLAIKSNSYTIQKDGVWYFSRRVPAYLQRHYRTGRIAYSLRAKPLRDARVRAMSDAAKLNRHWHILRNSCDDLPGKHLLTVAGQAKFYKLANVAVSRAKMEEGQKCAKANRK